MSTFALATTAANGSARAKPAFSAEFGCVLACLRWPLDDAAIADVERAAGDVADWDKFVALAQRHRVAGLVAHALKTAGVTLPGDARAALATLAAEQTRQSLVHAAETIRVDRLLRASGVEPVFLKGSTLTLLAYGRLELRHAKDVDVLVAKADAMAAIDALDAGGYVPFPGGGMTPEQMRRWLRFGKSMDWLHVATGALLELHWRMSDLPLLEGALASDQRRRVALTGGAAVTTLDADHLFAYLCVHGAAHGWSRLKWLADVSALLPGDADAVEALYRRALALGAGRSAGLALLLCDRLFGLRLGAGLRSALMRDARLRLLVRMTLRLLARGGEVAEIYDLRFGTSSVYLSRFLLGKGATVSAVATLLFPVEQVAVSRLPLFLFPIERAVRWVVDRVRHGGRSA